MNSPAQLDFCPTKSCRPAEPGEGSSGWAKYCVSLTCAGSRPSTFSATTPPTRDRYSATNTIKMQGNVLIGKGTVLYSDLGNPLFNVIEDTCGSHDTIAGCCSEANNFLRYGVRNTPNCYANFLEILGKFGLGRNEIVANVNFFMRVPVEPDGRVAIVDGISKAGSYVDLRAERDVLAVISNCPQMHNPCNAFNPTPIRCMVRAAG